MLKAHDREVRMGNVFSSLALPRPPPTERRERSTAL